MQNYLKIAAVAFVTIAVLKRVPVTAQFLA